RGRTPKSASSGMSLSGRERRRSNSTWCSNPKRRTTSSKGSVGEDPFAGTQKGFSLTLWSKIALFQRKKLKLVEPTLCHGHQVAIRDKSTLLGGQKEHRRFFVNNKTGSSVS